MLTIPTFVFILIMLMFSFYLVYNFSRHQATLVIEILRTENFDVCPSLIKVRPGSLSYFEFAEINGLAELDERYVVHGCFLVIGVMDNHLTN